jgi:hypothetical protein
MRIIGIFLTLVLSACSDDTGSGPTVVSTEALGAFVGGGAELHPDNKAPDPIAYYGTDLGFSYVHGGQLHFLFGDSWATEAYAPIEESTGSRFDDSFGSIPLSEWPDPAAINKNNMPVLKLGQNPGTTEASAMNPGHAMDLGKTPMAGFSDGSREFAIFNITKPQGCRSDDDCDNGLTCDTGLGYVGSLYSDEENLTLACIEGGGFCQAETIADAAGSGFCSDRTSTVWADTPAGRISAVGIRQRVSLRSESNPKDYSLVREWLTNKFLNVTATMESNERVLLWGRPGFVGVNATGRSLGLYFAYVDLPKGPDFEWSINYFTGTDMGMPRYSENEEDAAPLDLDSSNEGIQPVEHHDVVHQMSVEWVPQLNKWLMFYGGSVTTLPSVPLPECGVLQLFANVECKQVVLGNGAIRMRTADNPWGPWSPPQDVIEGGDPDVPGSGQFGVGGMLNHPNCNEEGCAPHTQTPFYNENEYGFFYSANIIVPWITTDGDSVDILWNASTWDPYRVVLLRLPLVCARGLHEIRPERTNGW